MTVPSPRRDSRDPPSTSPTVFNADYSFSPEYLAANSTELDIPEATAYPVSDIEDVRLSTRATQAHSSSYNASFLPTTTPTTGSIREGPHHPGAASNRPLEQPPPAVISGSEVRPTTTQETAIHQVPPTALRQRDVYGIVGGCIFGCVALGIICFIASSIVLAVAIGLGRDYMARATLTDWDELTVDEDLFE